MDPIEFPGSFVTIAKDQPPYKPLPALVCGDPMGTMLFCWQPTEDEMETLLRERKVWVTCLTFNQRLQPLNLSAERPYFADAQGDTFPLPE